MTLTLSLSTFERYKREKKKEQYLAKGPRATRPLLFPHDPVCLGAGDLSPKDTKFFPREGARYDPDDQAHTYALRQLQGPP